MRRQIASMLVDCRLYNVNSKLASSVYLVHCGWNIFCILTYIYIYIYILEFYPSITEKLLDDVITWAKSLIKIPEDDTTVIKHARESLLFYNEKTWVKNNDQSLFDVTMGSYDGAEVCELVGLFLLNKLTDRFGKDSVGLYRDDGLLLLKGTAGRQAELTRKQLHGIFNKHDLRITAEINYHTVNFLDVTLNLKLPAIPQAKQQPVIY